MASPRASTPPPPSSLHTPPTPRHPGDYEPYSPPRKSSRISSQRAQRQAQTPPPQSTSSLFTTKKTASTNMPNSPPLTISKKRTQASKDSRRVSGSLTEDTMASAASALGLPKSEVGTESSSRSTALRGVLPTPDKTPRKRPSKPTPGISSIARNLFPVRADTIDEVMPSPKKNKKYSGFTLDSFGAEDVDEPIAIFTDSHDRVPEVDQSEDNPFYGSGPAVPEPIKRASKRRKIAVPGEGELAVEEAEKREDGLIYVFRGKKFFRKFEDDKEEEPEDNEAQAEVDVELNITAPSRSRGPTGRNGLKPRLLFPSAATSSKKQLIVPDEDEEAVTDIEEMHDISTPSDLMNEVTATPKAPRFAPASPPTTGRAARRSKRIGSSSPTSPPEEELSHGKRISPFDAWQRTKAGVDSSKKREGSESLGSELMSKRRRGPVSS